MNNNRKVVTLNESELINMVIETAKRLIKKSNRTPKPTIGHKINHQGRVYGRFTTHVPNCNRQQTNILQETVRKVIREVMKPGSVSHATMRTQDLIPRFMEVIRHNNPQRANELLASEPEMARALNDLNNGIESDWWDSEDASYILNDVLFDELDKFSPEGHYFGSHPGDGSDYGYWENDEDMFESCGRRHRTPRFGR